MYLFKCKCGCILTVKEIPYGVTKQIKCQNCGASISIYDSMERRDLKDDLAKLEMSLRVIPDDAKITVTFDS